MKNTFRMNIFWKDVEYKFKQTQIIRQHVDSLSVKFDFEKVKQTTVRGVLVKII